MIIDCHTHLGRNNHIFCSVKQLLDSMDKANIDKALVFAGEMNDCPNEWMIEQIKSHRDRLYGVAAYDLCNVYKYSRVYFQNLIQENNLVGIKFYTGYQHYYPTDLYSYDDIEHAKISWDPLKICEELKIPAIFHCGDCLNSCHDAKLKYAHPLHLDEAAVDNQNINFVIAHVGYPWVKDTAEVCFKNSNVYTDISGFVYENFQDKDRYKFKNMLLEFLDIAGSDKLLFGTDFPISNQSSYLEVLNWVHKDTGHIPELSNILTPQYMTQNVQRLFKI